MRNSSKLLLFSFLYFLSAAALGQQFSSEFWHEGRLILFEGDTLRGQIKYDMENQSVQYSADNGRIQAFSPRNILAFELYDEVIEAYRIFYVLPYRNQQGYESP
ncbi:MAG: hypothetical protein P8X57_11540, partial [Cyclobacteriaceae bacterium]